MLATIAVYKADAFMRRRLIRRKCEAACDIALHFGGTVQITKSHIATELDARKVVLEAGRWK